MVNIRHNSILIILSNEFPSLKYLRLQLVLWCIKRGETQHKENWKNLLRHETRRKKIFLFLRMCEVTSFCVSNMTLRGSCKQYRKNNYDDSGLNIFDGIQLKCNKDEFHD